MESNCDTCSTADTGEKLCLLKLQGLFPNYEDIKGKIIQFAQLGEDYGGRLLQFNQDETLEEFLKV